MQVAGEDGGLGLAPAGVERAEGGAGFIRGALRRVARLMRLRRGGLAQHELLARGGQRGKRAGVLLALLQAQRERGNVGGEGLNHLDAGGKLGAADSDRLLLRGGGDERLVGGKARGGERAVGRHHLQRAPGLFLAQAPDIELGLAGFQCVERSGGGGRFGKLCVDGLPLLQRSARGGVLGARLLLGLGQRRQRCLQRIAAGQQRIDGVCPRLREQGAALPRGLLAALAQRGSLGLQCVLLALVGGGTEQGFEDLLALGRARRQQLAELALRQRHDLAELLGLEAEQFLDQRGDLGGPLRQRNPRLAVGLQPMKRGLGEHLDQLVATQRGAFLLGHALDAVAARAERKVEFDFGLQRGVGVMAAHRARCTRRPKCRHRARR